MINPSVVNPLLLPSVSLEERLHLPTIPCIYFVIDSTGVVQYIGKSVNSKARWASHHKLDQVSNLDKPRIAWLEVSDNSLLQSIESALIQWFNPPLNETRFGTGSHIKGMLRLRIRAGKRAEDIAVELGVAISTVRNWEQLKNVPRMTPKGLQRLMEVYSCTFEELIQAENEMEAAEQIKS